MSLARSTPREATVRDERETTESTAPILTEMTKSVMASSLYKIGVNQHPEGMESKVNVEAATGSLTKATVETPHEKLVRPFLTIPYLLAQATHKTARTVLAFHMQSIHIARHAVNLVTLLNETVENEGATDEQLDEGIQLQNELMDLDDAMKKWGAKDGAVGYHDERVEEIRRQYDIFFGERFYHPDARDYQFLAKVMAYDDRAIERYTSSENFDLLVYILTRLRDEGNPRPYTSTVDAKLTPQPQRIYESAGVTNFKEYATCAERMGIIRLGGDSDGPGKQWMELVATD